MKHLLPLFCMLLLSIELHAQHARTPEWCVTHCIDKSTDGGDARSALANADSSFVRAVIELSLAKAVKDYASASRVGFALKLTGRSEARIALSDLACSRSLSVSLAALELIASAGRDAVRKGNLQSTHDYQTHDKLRMLVGKWAANPLDARRSTSLALIGYFLWAEYEPVLVAAAEDPNAYTRDSARTALNLISLQRVERRRQRPSKATTRHSDSRDASLNKSAPRQFALEDADSRSDCIMIFTTENTPHIVVGRLNWTYDQNSMFTESWVWASLENAEEAATESILKEIAQWPPGARSTMHLGQKFPALGAGEWSDLSASVVDGDIIGFVGIRNLSNTNEAQAYWIGHREPTAQYTGLQLRRPIDIHPVFDGSTGLPICAAGDVFLLSMRQDPNRPASKATILYESRPYDTQGLHAVSARATDSDIFVICQVGAVSTALLKLSIGAVALDSSSKDGEWVTMIDRQLISAFPLESGSGCWTLASGGELLLVSREGIQGAASSEHWPLGPPESIDGVGRCSSGDWVFLLTNRAGVYFKKTVKTSRLGPSIESEKAR